MPLANGKILGVDYLRPEAKADKVTGVPMLRTKAHAPRLISKNA